ncbi:glycogen debranching N-terminal domain-containing protein [Kineosporia babensis]|uniref:Amylo-alpha-1,6-glucosidase n=1 Tax=Kineosporia babensis TaxID=499548 RepID=A0A9X1SRH8_9ACTN|nr:glycogen debranching N-terminal domain-containing protein [Kineosporia babensis]MCD5309642.1 hypothetical protein [Kineosporia babensis]
MSGTAAVQPWLHDLVTTLCAPTTALCEPSGQIRGLGAQGVSHCDIRVLSRALLRVDGEEPTLVGGGAVSAGVARFVSVSRATDDAARIARTRTVRAGWVEEEITLSSVAEKPISLLVTLELATDLARVEAFRSGRPTQDIKPAPAGSPDSAARVEWDGPGVQVTVSANGARREYPRPDDSRPTTAFPPSDSTPPSAFPSSASPPTPSPDTAPTPTASPLGSPPTATNQSQSIFLSWEVELPPHGTTSLTWNLSAHVDATAVTALHTNVSSSALDHTPTATAGDPRIPALLRASWSDLRALRMTPSDDPSAVFLAAGSPWYFTLFGRDSIWAARFLLPFGTALAEGTLRALATRQGTKTDIDTAEEPGKIPHEIRSTATEHGSGESAMSLPPLYYGTVDATPLWICLLHDSWRWGMPETVVVELLPALEAALGWMHDQGEGFLKYQDESGHGLANQCWKDSPDSVRFFDGTIAEGPVALCEVQGYAYEAAVRGAGLLDHFGRPGAAFWRDWADRLAERFRAEFWVTRADGLHLPALALDGSGRPVDSLTSNIGHLLGTGLLSAEESEHVAALLATPALSSGYGLRTMATTEGGYDPLSYHCGSVWAHDTAIAVHGLARSGLGSAAFGLIEGLLAAGADFGYRLPELYSGDPAGYTAQPIPYPSACRPQAWSAAAIGPIVQALAGLSAENGTLECLPPAGSPFGALEVSGLRFGPEELSVVVESGGRGRLSPPR